MPDLIHSRQPVPGDRARARRTVWRRLGVGALLLALYGGVAPQLDGPLGLELDVRTSVEVVDHVIPALVLVPIAAFAAVAGRLPLVVALAAVLAALWMAATHVPLVAQAGEGEADAGAAAWHSAPGLALLVLTTAAAVLAWRDDRPER